jgi:hypothetical protein
MKKKILIAGFFASIMLLVPFSSISGGYVVVNSNTIEENVEAYPVIPDYLLEELMDKINYLLANYDNEPEVVEICNEILEVINPDNTFDILGFCDMLYEVFRSVTDFSEFAKSQAIYYKDKDLAMYLYYITLASIFEVISMYIFTLGLFFRCWGGSPNTLIDSESGLNLQLTQQSITGLTQSQEVNMCPCGQ